MKVLDKSVNKTGTLSVLIFDDLETRATSVASALEAGDGKVVAILPTTENLPVAVEQYNPDVIIIDMDAPSGETLEQISQVSAANPRPIVMFAHDNKSEKIQAAIRAGVSAYVVDGLSDARVRSVVDVAIARFQEHEEMRAEMRKIKASVSERKMVERAKGVLMIQLRCSEKDAHRILQKLAMDRRSRMLDVAGEIFEASGRQNTELHLPEWISKTLDAEAVSKEPA